MPDVNNQMGMWIYITDPDDGFLTVVGGEPSSTSTPLSIGWNMVGYAAQDDSTYTVGDLKTDTGATIVQGYTNSPGPPDRARRPLRPIRLTAHAPDRSNRRLKRHRTGDDLRLVADQYLATPGFFVSSSPVELEKEGYSPFSLDRGYDKILGQNHD